MRKRAAEDEEWEAHKNEIVRIYKHENKPLPQVMALMASRTGFKRTKAQYERYLKKWAIKKNSKAAEWKLIARRYHEREAQRHLTSVEIRGVVFSPAKVRKEVARYGYQTTMERFTSGLPYRQRSETPPGIRVFTPLGSLSPHNPEPVECIPNLSLSHPETTIPWTDKAFFYMADCTPWHPFMRFVHSLETTGPSQLLSIPGTGLADATRALPSPTNDSHMLEVIHGKGNSHLKHWLDDILCGFYLSNHVSHFVPNVCINPKPYLPPKDGPPDVDVNAIMDLSTKSTQLELLKHAVNLVSNNFDVKRVSSVIVDLAHDKHNRSLLQSLFGQKLLIADAFAEKLLNSAVAGKNMPLIKILLEAGCDIDMRESGESALQCAVKQGDEELVSFLLDNGASDVGDVEDNMRLHNYQSGFRFTSHLDFAVSRGSLRIVKELLKPRPTFKHRRPEITIDTLRFAVHRGDIEMFQFLIDHDPNLHDLIHLEPWILLEAAAAPVGTSTFSAIERYGLDFNKTSRLCKGSPLAVAAAWNNMALVSYLSAKGANLDSTMTDDHYRFWFLGGMAALHVAVWNENEDMAQRLISKGLGGMAALHIAVWMENEDIAQLLISKGADVNQCCHIEDCLVFPIQLATYRENEVLVGMLLDAGAVPSTVAGKANPLNIHHVWMKYPHSVSGWPAAHIALEMGNATLFDQLLQRDAIMPSFSACVEGWDPLFSAIRGGNCQLVKHILQEFEIADRAVREYLVAYIIYYGYDTTQELINLGSIQPEDIYNPNVLCVAVIRGDMGFVQRLLTDAKASIGKLPPGYGATGFAVATRYNKFDMIPIFLSAGIKPYETRLDINARLSGCRCAKNALVGAVEVPLRAAKQFGLLINACDEPVTGSYEHDMWRSALFAAAQLAMQTNPEFVPMIIAKGIDINWTIQGYGTLLQTCLKYGHDSPTNGHSMFQHASQNAESGLFEHLLRRGADVFAPPGFHRGATALQYAAIHGNFDIVNMLLKAGVSINEPAGKHKGRTAIEGAAEHGRLNMVSYLLEAGANVKGRTNQNYRRTIYRAWKEGHRTLVRMVQNWKRERYGVDDCEDTEVIIESMTYDELSYESPVAKLEYEEWEVQAQQHPLWIVLD